MKRYYNETTKEWYNEGQSMTRRIENGVFAGVPTEEQLTEWGFVEYVAPTPTPEELLRRAKDEKISELERYDKSNAIENFVINRNGEFFIDYWINRDLRTSLKDDVETAKGIGNTYDFDIRELGITLTLNCEKFLQALGTLRVYAYKTFNVTSRHMAAIEALESVEDVEAYDYTVGYPPQLEFNIEDLV